jgi:DNA-binding MarR family transcriptional regulator
LTDELTPLLRTTQPAWALLRAVGAVLHRELGERGHDRLRAVHIGVCAQVLLGRTKLSEIAPRVMVTKQAVSLLVSELEQMGYLERSVDPDDRRTRTVKLTPWGQAAAADAAAIMARMNEAWLEAVGPERLAQCQDTLRDLERALASPHRD